VEIHTQLVGEKSPSPLVQNPVGILHLKAVASLRLHRYACACGKEKTVAPKRKTNAKYLYRTSICPFDFVCSAAGSPSMPNSISAFCLADCKSKTCKLVNTPISIFLKME